VLNSYTGKAMTCFTTAEAMGIYSKTIYHRKTRDNTTARIALTVYKRRWCG